MVEAEKQGIIHFVGLIVAILIGIFVWQSELHDQWEGLFAFGIVLFALLIISSLMFGRKMDIVAVLWIGIVSLITTAVGSFYTFDLFFTIILTIVISIVIGIISLFVKS